MGQNNSRSRQPTTPADTPFPLAGPTAEIHPEDTPDAPRDHRLPSGSRRSVRKSLLNLVKPTNLRSRVASTVSSPGDLRRSWRSSRRWSRAPADDPVPTPIEPLPPSVSAPVAGPSTLDKGKQPEKATTTDDEDEEYHEASEGSPSVPPPPSSLESAPQAAHIDPVPVEEGAPQPTGSHTVASNADIPSATPASDRPAPTTSFPRPAASGPQPHQFPPPGTLVVVQGIVHTTDVSRAPAAPLPDYPLPQSQEDASRSRTRNRLSALLRPRSTSSRPPSTILSERPPSVIDNPASNSDSPSSDVHLDVPLLADESGQSGETTATPQPDSSQDQDNHQAQSESNENGRLPSISSSSIDVLGTLLSVAAAATAASLLTGSSEPILPAALAPPTESAPPLGTVPLHAQRAMPDLAAGRAERMRQAWSTIRERLGLRPSAPPAELGSDGPTTNDNDAAQTAPTDTRELMLAEMARAFNIGLGLNGLGGMPSTPNQPQGENDTPGARNGDSDIGNAGDNAQGSSERPTDRTAGELPELPSNANMPPEGSFERFLVDLQIDLRAALTQVENEVAGEDSDHARDGLQPEVDQQEPPFIPHPTSHPVEPSTSIEHAVASRLSDIPTVTIGQPNHGDSDQDSIPPLHSVSTDSDSDSDFGDDDEDDLGDADFHSASHSSVHLQDHSDHEHDHFTENAANTTSASGPGRIDSSGRINWWRLYRFPPIVSPRPDANAILRQAFGQSAPPSFADVSANLNGMTAPSIPSTTPLDGHEEHVGPSNTTSDLPISDSQATTTTAIPSSPVVLPPESTSGTSSTPPRTENPTTSPTPTMPPMPSPPQSVVPVIVVGLQSVNSEWRPDMPMQGENEGMDIFGQPSESTPAVGVSGEPSTNTGDNNEALDEENLDTYEDGRMAGDARPHGRRSGWHNRAANAIRNLRPGRRQTETGGMAAHLPSVAPGSRTFLIYVIGGYYPPDHSIVTGGPHNLDSFEALLELADLLGHVKPPTVSKDEIEKSGLEIIRSAQISQYEEEGKISSNCTDRCLICLDDYKPEEDIRVMSCRHAFHKGCVDEWLQRGRNNCPACRSTGVSHETQNQNTHTPAF